MAKGRFTPQYQTIYETLKAQILSGAYAPGSRLPFERELCETYGVQRITVRKALELLVQDDLICKQPGKGSFVREQNPTPTPSAASATLLFAMDKSCPTLLNASAYNVQLFFLMEQLCLARGCTLLYVGVSDANELGVLAEKHSLDGAFLVGGLPEDCVGLLNRRGIPSLCVNHAHPDALSVLADNHGGMREAVGHLARLGHRRIAFLGAKGSVNSQERLQGFLSAAYEFDLTVDPALLLMADGAYEGSCAAVSSMLSAQTDGSRPTALIAAGDMMAIGAMESASRLGLRVPDDLSVIGFGNADLCRFCSPQLTSVGPSMQQMASVAVDHLLPLLHRAPSPDDHYALRVPVMLIERSSTAPVQALSLASQR